MTAVEPDPAEAARRGVFDDPGRILVEDEAGQFPALGRELGLLQAFAQKASKHIVEKTRPWPGVGVARGSEDPHVLRQYGRFAARLIALEELFQEILAVPAEARAPRDIALARRFARDLGGAGISETVALLGASAASERDGFHLFWLDFQSHQHRFAPDAPGAPDTLTSFLEKEVLA